MPKFKVSYLYDGCGYTFIEAKTKEEAEEKYHDGEYGGEYGEEIEDGQNYIVDTVEEIK